MSKLPFLTLQQIQATVDNVRLRHPVLSEIPIDSEEFAEIELGIEIIPVKRLRERVGADAFITRDFLSILIDDIPEDLRQPPGNHFEALEGRNGYYSIRVNDQWRLTFSWNEGAENVAIEDYH